ncbi:YqiA/YcfP family alpha/beta fold hydrolase [Agaribacterium sp. ZY112]|uniref:YqiA/YcfP family alpha/beta fold hydrolase n=1 Tax=Agaribacterium sp. ZY112 TaxID=3233574 RepID=UPI00352384C1
MADKHVIYIHGFLSSPRSFKAQATEEWLRAHRSDLVFHCPQLSSYPEKAKQQLSTLLNSLPNAVAIGSSLGGYWASHFVELGLLSKAVLVNPAVSPHTRFQSYVGQELKSYYSDDSYCLQAKDLATLAECESGALKDVSRYWLLQQKGDEVLDWTMAAQRYRACRSTIEDGGNHSFEAYERWIPEVIRFLVD